MKIFKIFHVILIFSLALISCKNEEKSLSDAHSAEFRGYAKEFITGLKSVLMKNMREGGPLKAVSVCSDTASELTKLFSEKNGIIVKRVSFKNRNIENMPDRFEKNALDEFEMLYNKNELKSDSEIIKKVFVDGKEVIRYIEPIIVEASCLNCHGDREILPEVSKLIREKYPNDNATGYRIGDLRGAISITKKI